MHERRSGEYQVPTSTFYRSYRRCLMETATKRRLRASPGVSDRRRAECPRPLSFRLQRARTEAEAVRMVEADVEKWIMDLGKSVVIKGELSASEDLTLDGQMEGSVTLPDHTLTIGPAANIKASIFAKAVVIMGAVTGNVTAGEKVEIRATGSVTGDLTSPRLVVAEGGHLRGRVTMPLTGSHSAP